MQLIDASAGVVKKIEWQRYNGLDPVILDEPAPDDSVALQLRGGTECLTVLEVCYERISVEPFREPLDPRPESNVTSPTSGLAEVAHKFWGGRSSHFPPKLLNNLPRRSGGQGDHV